ncbi:hypothetical protein B0T11DRAFT_328028 [Plectosphaerella cucumerina]|uniref:Ankyrin repeat protein n=1 Tax=Plectosphaerella cucumerina TaxID=40658 RepID=A0A8K0X4M0_9PEZI|nr:hypothetical protein B0T11DRAFT_328028 [Plectosphaerella cucumerina]
MDSYHKAHQLVQILSRPANQPSPPWAAALLHGDQDAALDVLARAPIPSQRPDTEHPAVFAARMNAPRVVAHFIQTGQVDATDLLRHVPANTHAETYRSILEHGADPNARNFNGFSILQWACEERNVELAHLLLSHGADVKAFDQ